MGTLILAGATSVIRVEQLHAGAAIATIPA